MNKVFSFALLSIVCALLFGCQNTDVDNLDKKNNNEIKGEGGGDDMDGYDIYDFYFIDKAPEATEIQSLNHVIKVLFSENDSSLSNTIAIDVKHNEIYINPRWSSLGIRAKEGTKKVSDAKRVVEILEKHNVQKWEREYNLLDPDSYEDGYAWHLWLQLKDGSVQKYEGNDEGSVPENFNEFVEELGEFANEQLTKE